MTRPSADADAPPGASDVADSGPEFCTGQAVSVAELASGNVRAGAELLVPNLVASSQKFLLSVSKTSGKCLWAAFAAEAGTSGENSGVLLLSYGENASGNMTTDGGGAGTCPLSSDSLPDDLAPGDQLAAFGSFTEFVPEACKSVSPMRELMIKPGCALTRTGRGEPPAVAEVSFEQADQFAQGTDSGLLSAWSGARIELQGLSALPVAGSASAVDPYGVIRFQETKLELHTKIPYSDVSSEGPHDPRKSLEYAYPAHFERATGVLFLDYCTWSLEVCDRCRDLAPQSRGCVAPGG